MRTIGNLESEKSASRFSSTLYAKGIENQIESEEGGQYSVWVIEEEQIAPAAELLKRFRANPAAAEFAKAESLAEEQRERAKQADSTTRSTVADSARVGYERHFNATPLVPIALIVIAVAVAIYTQFGSDIRSMRGLLFSDPGLLHMGDLAGSFAEIRAGQLWRLVTPAFIHFNIPHLLFNAMMLYDLGSFIERRFGPRYLIWLFLAIAVSSNIGQVLWHGPVFGGLSGVDYGLFGFLWIRGKFDRTAGWELNKNTVTLLIVWLLLGYSGLLKELIGNVANGAHTVGLVAGMGWGYLSAKKN
ncbi:MAG: Rhomboid family protein [Chthoniobacteraceae bacterium]|nr:Rhomboid family protein [Chthoniobacteraceae bacterium]